MVIQDWHDPQEARRWDMQGDKTNPVRVEQLDILISLIADHLQPGKWIVDLGYGSGLVEQQTFARIPEARVIGIDTSSPMMELAQVRLASYLDRFHSLQADLSHLQTIQLPNHPYQFVIAIQSLHHLSPAEMYQAYRWIYRILEPGGWFLLLDRLRVECPDLWPVFQSVWTRQDRIYGSLVTEHEGSNFTEHLNCVNDRGDKPLLLDQHLTWLREVGFIAACIHLHGNRGLLVGRKKEGAQQ